MDRKKVLVEKLSGFVELKEQDVVYDEQLADDMTFLQLRDRLVGNGTILDEDFEKQIYVVKMMAGVAKMNAAVVALSLMEEKLIFAAYSHEGVIKQHTAEKSIKKIKEKLR